jgi:hypothetical protein
MDVREIKFAMMKKLLLALGLMMVAAPTAMAQYYDDEDRPRRYAPQYRDYRYAPPPPPVYREREDYRPYRPHYSRGGWGNVCAAVKNTNCVMPRAQPIGSGCICVTGSGSNREGQIVR